MISYISDIQAERKLKRIDELIISLGVDLHGLEEKIRKEFVEKDDFKDIIEETFRKVAQERTIEKRIAYKNILLNSMVDNSLDYDEVEEFLRLLERLQPAKLLLLKVLYNPSAFNEEKGFPIVEKTERVMGLTISIKTIMSKLLPDWDHEKILDAVGELENERLVKNFVSNYPAMLTYGGVNHIENRITSKDQRFYRFIIQPNQ